MLVGSRGHWTSNLPICSEGVWVSPLPGWWQWDPAGSWTSTCTKPCMLHPKRVTTCKKRRLNIIQSLSDGTENTQDTIKNHSSYQEVGQSHLEWEKTIHRCQHWDESDAGIICQKFLSSHHNNASVDSYTQGSGNTWKKNLSKEIGVIKKEPKGNYRTGKYSNWNKIFDMLYCWLETTKKIISVLENRSVEITKSE